MHHPFQINLYMENKFSNFKTGFRSVNRIQHSLVTLLRKRKNALDQKEYICALSADLSIPSDNKVNDKLLQATLHEYVFLQVY